MASVAALHVYPVKSCRGLSLECATAHATGLDHDRQWMIVSAEGRFVTQRDEPRLALIETSLGDGQLSLSAPEMGTVSVALDHRGASREVIVWKSSCLALDAGDEIAAWLESFLGRPLRLVRFDPARTRLADSHWTGDSEAPMLFADGFPYLLVSQSSLDDLNARLPQPLAMNRFRPNLVVDGLPPYGEDDVYELAAGDLRFRAVKGCTRCIITTTDQDTGRRDGTQPLQALRDYRLSRELKGVIFGQNVILAAGAGLALRVGQELAVHWRKRE